MRFLPVSLTTILVELADLDDRVAPVEDDDSRVREDGHDLVAAVRVVVVVPEHREDRHLEAAARVRENRGLVGQAVRRQVAGEEDELGPVRERGERALEALPQRLRGVDVGRGSDADALRHLFGVPARGVPGTREPGIHRPR